ncbi:MAG: apolipoprotein N-acyltransferase [Deltaproteobacteria bacterium]|nr:apolipoprotein N-acyltransferase [Deltaproteobacteria bacterium]
MKKFLPLLLTSLITFLAFPTLLFRQPLPSLGLLAWFSLVPLFIFFKDKTPRQVFWTSFIAGFLFYSGAFYWIYNALHYFGHLSPSASLGALVVMMTAMTLYLAGALALARWLSLKTGLSFYLLLPWTWVVQDFCLNYFPVGGFSWGALAYTQTKLLPMIQIADLGGPYLVTFLIVLLNASIARVLVREKGAWVQSLLVSVLLILTVGYGFYRILSYSEEDRPHFQVSLLQGNIPQEEKWQERRAQAILGIYQEMMDQVVASDLVVWPEASYPYLLSFPLRGSSGLGASFKFDTIVGAVTGQFTKKETISNSALLIKKGGEFAGAYHKLHLVPFGEYVPYQTVLSFLHKVVPVIGEMKAGEDARLLKTEKAQLAPLICYEDLFPEIARNFTKKGADLLVNITNDAWYGVTSAPIQHMELSRFRAIENRRYLIRSTNTGLSAIIDPLGRVVKKGRLFQREMMEGEVVLGGPTTFYTRHGDLFAWGAVVVVVILGLISCFKNKENKG